MSSVCLWNHRPGWLEPEQLRGLVGDESNEVGGAQVGFAITSGHRPGQRVWILLWWWWGI